MSKLLDLTYTFIFCLTIVVYSSCKSKPAYYCGLNTRMDSIELIYPDSFIVNYKLNKKFIDISDSIWFRHWGADEMKKYLGGQDTITLSWYYNQNVFTDSIAIDWIERTLKRDSLLACEHSILEVNLNQLNGAICEITCEKSTGMIFFGVNNTTNYLLLAYYNTTPKNHDFRDEFICFLNSMSFH